MSESDFQADLIAELRALLPDCIILKNDASYLQGFPDLLVLWKYHWAALECKTSKNASARPNQKYWVERASAESFAAFIFPENKKEILDELQRAWKR